jgi:hypothetical protein
MTVIALPKLSQVRGEVRREPNGTPRYMALQLLAEMLKNRRIGLPVTPKAIVHQMGIVAKLSSANM